jgi:SAM-dependent methyltransferase
MSFWVPERRPSIELLDEDLPAGEAEESLADIEWVHRHMGGRRMVHRRLLPILLQLPGPRLSLLDLGCGSGHVGRDLEAASADRGLKLRVFGLDLKLAHARFGPAGRVVAGNALALPVSEGAVDVVFSTLFLHHFAPDELARIFSEARRAARHAVVFFDLSRHRAALAIISLVGPLAFRSRVSVLDGRASVRQAYTPAEIRRIAGSVLPGAAVESAGPFAWQLTFRK